jgi:hypothetical protein
MDAYNAKLLSGGPEANLAIANRLRWHWEISPESARACSLCGQCEEKCTQHLPIQERLKEIAARKA